MSPFCKFHKNLWSCEPIGKPPQDLGEGPMQMRARRLSVLDFMVKGNLWFTGEKLQPQHSAQRGAPAHKAGGGVIGQTEKRGVHTPWLSSAGPELLTWSRRGGHRSTRWVCPATQAALERGAVVLTGCNPHGPFHGPNHPWKRNPAIPWKDTAKPLSPCYNVKEHLSLNLDAWVITNMY